MAKFTDFGINIHEAEHLTPVETLRHQKFSNQYNKEWEAFFNETGITKEDVIDFSKYLEKKYNLR